MEELKKPATIGVLALGCVSAYLILESNKSREENQILRLKLAEMETRMNAMVQAMTEFSTSKTALESATLDLSNKTKSIIEKMDEIEEDVAIAGEEREDFVAHYNNNNGGEKYIPSTSTSVRSLREERNEGTAKPRKKNGRR
jgi:predicted nuclease with TOPRIM domain